MTIMNRVKSSTQCLLAGLFVAVPILATTSMASAAANSYDANFQAAADEFKVPVNLLKAISYNQTRWSSNNGAASIDGGYGLMDLATKQAASTPLNGKGDTTQKPIVTPTAQTHYTLDEASSLLHVPAATLKSDPQQNARGAAADLAKYARDLNNNQLPTSTAGWYTAVAAYSGDSNQATASSFADDVYTVLQSGATASSDSGQTLSIAADPAIQPDKQSISKLSLKQPANNQASTQGAECPSTLNCRFIPAGYAQNNPNDPTDYGNYDPANRPTDMKIQYIIIHDTEGSYTSAIQHFQDTTSYVSAHYVIRSSDGAITQMVHDQDVSWGANDWYINMHGINIEHEGFAANGATWYTPAMYKSSATLVRWLAQKYGIPIDRNHIIGHDNAPTPTQDRLADQHWDPGPFWNWGQYMNLVKGNGSVDAVSPQTTSAVSDVVTIDPKFAANTMSLQDCSSIPGTCTTLPTQGTSIVYLHTSPSQTAPLLSDATLHPDGKPGTMEISDWSASASAGEQYAVAGATGNWLAIWFGGQKGWFYNPANHPVAYYSTAATVTPKAGKTSIPVYGRPVPEASAYPSGVTPLPVVPLNYTIPSGQSYTATGGLTNDYYYDLTIDYSAPHDHEIFVGNTKYYQISYNHRLVYVKASDVSQHGLN